MPLSAKEADILRKRDFSSKVSRLSKRESIQLLKIFQKHNIKYTENFNGCYINIGHVDGDILDEITAFVDMCFEIQVKNKIREDQIKKYEEEFDTGHSSKTFHHESVPYENAQLTAIKNDKNLNSLEKSIMTENLKNSLSDKPQTIGRKSLTPKYTGARARLLKSCRLVNINRSSSGTGLTSNEGSTASAPKQDLEGPEEEPGNVDVTLDIEPALGDEDEDEEAEADDDDNEEADDDDAGSDVDVKT